jgi:hypothetical protein
VFSSSRAEEVQRYNSLCNDRTDDKHATGDYFGSLGATTVMGGDGSEVRRNGVGGGGNGCDDEMDGGRVCEEVVSTS